MAQQSDPRSNELKREMAEHFAEFEADYRDADWCTIVDEDDQRVIIADHRGEEFDEWDSEFREDFSTIMHTLAKENTDYNWGYSWPVVFDKLE